ncbi:2,3-diphosphoglycerate-dependent phosphoglycerate mutase [Rossellomorea aquimaris]|uniref:2,3-diphosphoglycerate-dependent phosphoglycerate mutase n=1 Tax=Rossellomorea aquimaris TaxID=189382 RepID=UPI001CD4D83E|nr:2,3-diphosphoglycerate-dependent phosphoglycerate mutase [Rossellomorea aquimaris]MCA1054035.1 2,3-diphosphoglycerate-dependent phosphoglycerate mutase [Rossellomorea aquimaris]
MKKIVFIRHGESEFNLQHRFTGWTDVDLTEDGYKEARIAGAILKKHGYQFDAAHTSLLKRAIRTLWIMLHEMDLVWIPVYKSWRLNERHYGNLQGLDKDEVREKFGEEQVHEWRRSADIKPPDSSEEAHQRTVSDPKYAWIGEGNVPLSESLIDTEKRALVYWNETIIPSIQQNQRIIVSAHGNTLRALVKYLDHIPDDGIVSLNIPNSIPLVYELDDDLNPIRHYYLNEEGEMPEGAVPKHIDLDDPDHHFDWMG